MVTKKRSSTRPALSAAVQDLSTELHRLRSEKSMVKRSISKTTATITADREQEKRLQAKITTLAQQEVILGQKKKQLQIKSDQISEKASKVSKIKSEMADI